MRSSAIFALITATLLAPLPAPKAHAQAAASSAATAPATSPRLSPAEAEVRDTLRALFSDILAGDEKRAFPLIAYAKPENRRMCEGALSEAAAGRRLTAVVAIQFGKDAADQLDLNQEELETMQKNLDKARVIIKGDSAEVLADPRIPPYVMIRKDQKWLLDFEKSQDNMGPPPDAKEAAAHAAGYDQIALDVKTHKLKNFQEVKDAVRQAQMITTLAPAGEGGMPNLKQ